jgi:CheY-like chemotaxis protein
MNVLIVDDEPEIREIYQYTLMRDGYASVTRDSGNEAIAYLEHNTPDVIVTDLLMPNGSGMQVIDEAKRRDIPVVIVTGFNGAYEGVLPPNARVLQKGGSEIDALGAVLRELKDAARSRRAV